MSDALAGELAALLDEDPAAAAARADRAFDEAVAGRPLVLHGAGGNGRRVLAALRASGIEPLCFSDAAPRAPEVDGLAVRSADEAVRDHGSGAVFVNCVYNPAAPHATVRDWLAGLGAACVVSWIPLAWKLGSGLLPAYAVDRPEGVLRDPDAVRAAYALLADDASREEFVDQVRWRLHADSGALASPLPVDESYFTPSLVTLREDEVFADGGAYDGDTLRAFAERSGGRFARFLAFEPDPANLERLAETLRDLPDVADRVEVLEYALSDERGTARWSVGEAAAGMSDAGELEVRTAPLDELLDGRPVTYVKLDIEGAEPAALRGARESIRRHRPVLGVCVYHAQDHLWTLPALVDELTDGYRLHLRRYEADGFQVVLYAIPDERSAA